jgi:hypothetical protein
MIKNILTTYEVAQGRAISLPKSEIYYSSAVEQHMHALSCKSLASERSWALAST